MIERTGSQESIGGIPVINRSSSLEEVQETVPAPNVPLPGGFETGLKPDTQPEIEEVGQDLYNSVACLIHCPKHKKIILKQSPGPRKYLWFPFFVIHRHQTWRAVCNRGILHVLTNGNSDLLKEKKAYHPPVIDHIMKMQVTETGKCYTRILCRTHILSEEIIIENNPDWRCCQDSNSYKWISLISLVQRAVDRLWGPEPFLFIHQVVNVTDNKNGDLITNDFEEISVNHIKHLIPAKRKKRSSYERILVASIFQEADVINLFSEFTEHCYPSFFMTSTSFFAFLEKIQWQTDLDKAFLFKAFNFKKSGYLSFHEFLCGFAALDQAAEHGGRSGEIRNYFSTLSSHYCYE